MTAASLPSETEALAERWRRLARGLGLRDNPGVAGWLIDAYREPHRRYHDLRHLAECLAELDRVRGLAEDAAEVELALWFHDAVYTPGDAGNEARSADLAREVLASLGCSAPRAERIAAIIEATDHRSPPGGHDADTALTLDIDLAILGRPAARYDAYAADIQAEAGLPPGVFRSRRAAFLRSMLARPALYATEAFRSRYEAAARANLERELASLAADP